jgi:exopolyphosphatase / guanosine-5'-triphosphate,3'-diphosphate pyrophosphatase
VKVAALDLGSNTSLLLIAEVEGRKISRIYFDDTRVTKMGQGVHSRRQLHPEALARLDACLAEYAEEILKHAPEKVFAVATSAARDVSNGEELMKLGRKYQIPIHIISGQKEAELTFRGALCDRTETEGLAVIDVGGGSTEIICAQNGAPKGTSVDVGSVRLSELFITSHPVPAVESEKVRAYAEAAFQRARVPRHEFKEVVAVAGTPTTLAALEQRAPFSESRVHGFKLSLDCIEAWLDKLAKMTVLEREKLPGMQPKRSDVIVAGGIILASAIRSLGKSQVTVSTRGVRFGAALAWQDF